MLIFVYPLAFSLVFAPVLVWLLAPAMKKDQGQIRVPFYSRLQTLGRQNVVNHLSARNTLRALAWLLLVVAIARPQRLEPPVEKTVPTRDLLLLVDLSASMSHEDFRNTDGDAIDRLSAVQQVVQEFVEKRKGDRVGLVVFGNAPFVQVPLTTDLELCNQLLRETVVGMAGPRTSIGDAIGLGISLLEESETPDKTMIVLTDGNDTASALPPVEAARVARNREITIYTIAVGDPESVGEEKIDDVTLREVAKSTSGDYYVALDREQLSEIYTTLDALETSEVKTVSHQPRSDLFYWPAALALLCSLLASFVPMLVSAREDQQVSENAVRLKVNARTFDLEAIER